MMIASGSRKLEPRWPFIALNSATAFESTVPRAHVVTPERPVIPTSSLVPAPRTIWRSSSIATNRLRRPLM